MEAPDKILFYDGSCGLCDKSVQWIVARDENRELHFAPLFGETYDAVLSEQHEDLKNIDSVVFYERGKVHIRSRAIANVGKYLTRGRWVRYLRFFPTFLADLGYRFIASIRYKVWGEKNVCRIPSPEERAQLLP